MSDLSKDNLQKLFRIWVGDEVKSKQNPEITGIVERVEVMRRGGRKTLVVENGNNIWHLQESDVELVAKNKKGPLDVPKSDVKSNEDQIKEILSSNQAGDPSKIVELTNNGPETIKAGEIVCFVGPEILKEPQPIELNFNSQQL